MKAIVLYLTGPTASGKTTLARKLMAQGWYGFIAGEVFRKNFPQEVQDGEDPVSPEYADQTILDAHGAFVQEICQKDFPAMAVVDGIPRHERQVASIHSDARLYGFTPIVWVTCVDEQLQEIRVRNRDVGDDERLKRDLAKLESEKTDERRFHEIIASCEHHKISCSYAPTPADINTPDSMHSAQGVIGKMMVAAASIAREKGSAEGRTQGEVAMHFLYEAVGEINEAINAAIKHDVHSPEFKGELADVLIYLMCMAHEVGITAPELANAYFSKCRINQHRISSGNKVHLTE